MSDDSSNSTKSESEKDGTPAVTGGDDGEIILDGEDDEEEIPMAATDENEDHFKE